MIFILFPCFFFFFFLSRPTRLQDSDGEKSDQDLVVDIGANETVSAKDLVKQNPNKPPKAFHKRRLHNKDAPETSLCV